MARARNIKPSFFTNEQVSDNCPLGRLLFIGLWIQADYKGDLEWREKTLKIQLLPWDNCSLKELAINLDKSGLIRFYSDGNKIFINIPNFEKHQNPHKNEKERGSDIPAYSDEMRQLIDLKGLTINRDKSRAVPECSHSDPADSLLLIPDSPILNPPLSASADFCSESFDSEPPCSDPPVIELLTNKNGETAKISTQQFNRWVETYPAVDVWQTLLRIRSWLENNPAKRKTAKGVPRFIDSWLAKEQDRPRINPGGLSAPQQFLNSREKNAKRNAEIFDYDRATDF
jgi:hypothetical protein